MERVSVKEGAIHVVEGEAPESDEEPEHVTEETPTSSVRTLRSDFLPTDTLVAGEAEESDDEQSFPFASDTTRSDQPASKPTKFHSLRPNRPSSRIQAQYNTLLHKKLREANEKLNVHSAAIFSKEFESANRSLRQACLQVGRSKQSIQEVSNTMRLITNDLFQLEDRIGIVSSCKLLPDITI